jgi:DNA-binding winged helix-turn-helix (wHTH) protein
MSVYQFYEFTFNSDIYQLSKGGINVNVRPKTALVLSYLIENRQSIVSKNELFEAVWQTTYVQNHTLFQVISEIRKLYPQDLIRTQPNIGYQWLAPTVKLANLVDLDANLEANLEIKEVNTLTIPFIFKKTHQLAVAASITILTCASFFLGQWSNENKPELVKNHYSMPAVSAYAKGILSYESGQYDEAKQWFDFSLVEDPSSMQSKLMLAESLFKQEQYTAAQGIAFELLTSVEKNSYHYSTTANLLSRIYAEQGLVFDALTYAINGANSLENSGAFCSIEVSEQRIEKLVQQLVDNKSLKTDKARLLAGYYKQTQKREQDPMLIDKNVTNTNSLCDQVNEQAENEQVITYDGSACLKKEPTSWLLSYIPKPLEDARFQQDKKRAKC